MNKPLRSFLQGSVSRLQQIGANSIISGGATFVIGNEAADADSIISSLTYAYLKQWIWDERSDTGVADNMRRPIIPITAIKRSEIHLRRDVELLLTEIGIDLRDLICVDECSITATAAANNLDLILVDHNLISSSVLAQLGAAPDDIVREVLDHHEDSGSYLSASVREIEFDMINKKPEVASTCTIIAEKYLQKENIGALNEDIATLLISVIAIDSLNMDPTQKRGTSRDLNALTSLQLLFPTVQRDRLYNLLINAKTDPMFWESLSAKDAIRLDFKDFKFQNMDLSNSQSKKLSEEDRVPSLSFGVASVLQSAESFLKKKDLDDELQSYFSTLTDLSTSAADSSDDPKVLEVNTLMAIMFLTFHPQLRRSLLFFSDNEDTITALTAYLSTNSLDLNLSELEVDFDLFVHRDQGTPHRLGGRKNIFMTGYHQENLEMSRKQVAPIISNFCSNLSFTAAP